MKDIFAILAAKFRSCEQRKFASSYYRRAVPFSKFKSISALTMLVILVACSDNGDKFVTQRVAIEIFQLTIPKTATINQEIKVQLKARAVNGCLSNLAIEFSEIDSRHFLFKGTALFRSSGICPDVMVYKDTAVSIVPTSIGAYFFQTNELPQEIMQDTIVVN